MNSIELLAVIRRSWWLPVSIALLAAGVSLLVELLQPARYSTTTRLLIHSSDLHPVDIEDALAYDLAAIVKGQQFDQDVATRLKQQGLNLAPEAIKAALSATNVKREVWLTAEASSASDAEAILQAALMQLSEKGLAYWGSTPQSNPGLSLVVEVLDPAPPAGRINGVTSLLRVILMRGLAGVATGCLLAYILDLLAKRRQMVEQPAQQQIPR